MNQNSELRTMVSSLRVHELQAILGCANQQRHGRKQDLIDRIIHLVEYSGQSSASALCLKIKEVYRRRFPSTAHTASRVLDNRGGHGIQPGPSRGPPSAYRPPNTLGTGQQSINNFARPSGAMQVSNGLGHVQQQQSNVAVPFPPRNQSSIKTFRLPFCDHLETVIPLTPLIAKNSGRNEVVYCFNVLNYQKYLTDLMSFSESKPQPRNELQLRFLRYEPGELLRDDFPPQCHVKIGENPVTLPPTIPTNKPNVEAKRQPLPVNITLPAMQNINSLAKLKLQINWVPDRERNFFFGIYLVRRVTSEILLQRLRNNGERPRAYTKQKIVEKMNLDTDADICTESLRVSLNCPLGMMRIQIPGKGEKCDHIQCFDASLFIKMNEKKPSWKCPVCHKLTQFDDLVIDGYFKEVLDRLKSDTDASEIEVFSDGNWKVVREDDAAASPPPKRRQTESAAPTSVLKNGSFHGNAQSSKPASGTGSGGGGGEDKNEEEVECIDLISDGSDDEDDSSRPSTTSQSIRPAQSKSVNPAAVKQSASSTRSSESPTIILLDSPPSSSSRVSGSRTEEEPVKTDSAPPPHSSHQALRLPEEIPSSSSSTVFYSGFTAPTNISDASARARTTVSTAVAPQQQPGTGVHSNIFESVFPGFSVAPSSASSIVNGVNPAQFPSGIQGFANSAFAGGVPQLWDTMRNQRSNLFPAYASVMNQYGYPNVDTNRVGRDEQFLPGLDAVNSEFQDFLDSCLPKNGSNVG